MKRGTALFPLYFRRCYFKVRPQHWIRRTHNSPDFLVIIDVWIINHSKLHITTVRISYNGPSLRAGKRCRKVALAAILFTGKRGIKDDQYRTRESWFQLHESRDTKKQTNLFWPNRTEAVMQKNAQVAIVFGFASCCSKPKQRIVRIFGTQSTSEKHFKGEMKMVHIHNLAAYWW